MFDVLSISGLILGVMGIRNVKQRSASNMKVAIAGLTTAWKYESRANFGLPFLGVVTSISMFAYVMFMLVPTEEEKACRDTARYPAEAEEQACIDELYQ